MFSKENLVSTLVTAIWGFGGGYLLWGLLADPYFQENALTPGLMKEMPDMPYLVLGAILWVAVLQSGIHATLAGVMLGFIIPLNNKDKSYSPLKSLEHTLHPYVAFFLFKRFYLFQPRRLIYCLGLSISLLSPPLKKQAPDQKPQTHKSKPQSRYP